MEEINHEIMDRIYPFRRQPRKMVKKLKQFVRYCKALRNGKIHKLEQHKVHRRNEVLSK